MTTFAYVATKPCTHDHGANSTCPHALHAFYDVIEVDNHDGRETVLAESVRLEPARRIVIALRLLDERMNEALRSHREELQHA